MKLAPRSLSTQPTYPTQPADSDEGVLDLSQVLRALQRKWPLIVGIATVVASAAMFKAMMDTPIYQGKFELLTESVTVESEVLSTIPDTLASKQEASQQEGVLDETKLRVLKSPKVISPLVEKLQRQYPEITYESLSNKLTVAPVGKNTNILQVSYADPDPAKVQTVLNLVAQAYVDYSLESRQADIRKGIRFVEEQLPQLETRVAVLEDRLQQFRQRHNLIDPEKQGQIFSDQATAFEEQRLTTQVELGEVKALYTDLEQKLASRSSESVASTALSENTGYQQLLGQIIQLDSQIAQQSVLFFEDTPNSTILREQRSSLVPLLNREALRVQGELATKIQALQARNQELTQAIDSINQKLKQFPAIAREYTAIQRELQVTTDNLNQFLAKREALRIDIAQKEVPWQLLTLPGRPQPSAASVKQNVILGAILGLLLGTAAALLSEKLNNTLHTVQDVKQATKRSLLGIIPLKEEPNTLARLLKPPFLGLGAESSNGYSDLHQADPFTEAFRSLYTNLLMQTADKPVRALVVSSATPNEGKTTISINLARAAAAMGQRVLLVDTDLRRPQVQNHLRLGNHEGLTHIISLGKGLDEIVYPLPLEDNLFVLTAGELSPDPTKILSSRQMRNLVEELYERFDLVIYDTPPLLGFADTYLTAAHADGMLLVVGLEKIKRPLLKQALEDLRIANTPILGVVANGAREQTGYTLSNYQRYYSQPVEMPTHEDSKKHAVRSLLTSILPKTKE